MGRHEQLTILFLWDKHRCRQWLLHGELGLHGNVCGQQQRDLRCLEHQVLGLQRDRRGHHAHDQEGLPSWKKGSVSSLSNASSSATSRIFISPPFLSKGDA